MVDTEKRKVLVNALSNVAFYATRVAVVFFVSPIIVHGLGDSRYGVWLLVDSILAYMALGDMGVGAAVVRYVARFEGLHDMEATNRVFSTSLMLFACVGALLLAITLPLVFLWRQPFGVTGELAVEMRWLLGIVGAQFAIALPLSIYKRVLAGLGRYPIINTYRVATLLIRNAGFVLVVYLGGGLRGIGVALLAAALVDFVCPVLAAHHYLPSLRFSVQFIDRATFRMIWAYSAFVFLSAIVATIGARSGALVIGAFLPTAAVTYFGIAAALSAQAGDGLRSAIVVLTPAVSKWDAQGDRSAVSTIVVKGTRYLLYLAVPVQIGLLLYGRPFISLWMGPEYADLCYPSLAILALSFSLALAMAMAARVLEGIGRVGSLFGTTVVQAVLSVGISVALVQRLGIEGVAWGATVPWAVQSVVVIVIACRASGVRSSTYVVRAWTTPTIAAGFLTLVWLSIRSWSAPTSTWPSLVGAVLIGLAFYCPALLCLDPSLRRVARQFLAALRQTLRRGAISGDTLASANAIQIDSATTPERLK